MPPVAANPVMQPIGQTARDAYMRPLQTCRKRPIITGYCNNKIHHSVGAGYAPPAVLRQLHYYGYPVGAAYMPPVAAIPVMQLNGQTARNGQDRSLQTCRKQRAIPALHSNAHSPIFYLI